MFPLVCLKVICWWAHAIADESIPLWGMGMVGVFSIKTLVCKSGWLWKLPQYMSVFKKEKILTNYHIWNTITNKTHLLIKDKNSRIMKVDFKLSFFISDAVFCQYFHCILQWCLPIFIYDQACKFLQGDLRNVKQFHKHLLQSSQYFKMLNV